MTVKPDAELMLDFHETTICRIQQKNVSVIKEFVSINGNKSSLQQSAHLSKTTKAINAIHPSS